MMAAFDRLSAIKHLTLISDSAESPYPPLVAITRAWNQQQIDVYGELLDAAAQLSEHIDTIDEDTRQFLIACAETAAASWTEKDRGIWEVRGDPQHFVYSKVMCWVALDRAITLADLLQASDRIDRWKQQRDEIWESVIRNAWSEEAGAFTQCIGSTALDAAFWLAQALALADQVDRARRVFERAAAFANDLGLLAEEVDPESGELLGNFPQAFSHIGLVNAAWAISEAERPARS
jgi:alpha,alpha-trehalase